MSGISSGIARRDDGSSRKSDDGSLDDDGSVRPVGQVERGSRRLSCIASEAKQEAVPVHTSYFILHTSPIPFTLHSALNRPRQFWWVDRTKQTMLKSIAHTHRHRRYYQLRPENLEKVMDLTEPISIIGTQTPDDAKPITVAIVEDDARLREGMINLFNKMPGFRCLGAYETAEAALKGIPELAPDVALVDIGLPRMSGIELVRRLHPLLPATRVLILSVYNDREHVFEALKAGASGYLAKKKDGAEWLKAIKTVHEGGAFMSSDIAAHVIEYFHRQGVRSKAEETLTAREREILDYLAKGYSYKEIADKIGVRYDTVSWHIRNVFKKLHCHSRAEAVAGRDPNRGKTR